MSLRDNCELIVIELAKHTSFMVTRKHKLFEDFSSTEQKQGIYTLLSKGEADLKDLAFQSATDGTQTLLLLGQIALNNPEPDAIEDAEFAMVDEIKALMNNKPEALKGLSFKSFQQSMQMEYPVAWVIANLELSFYE